jgi:hypothetical protein
VAQGEGPEFKPQNHIKKKKRNILKRVVNGIIYGKNMLLE